MNLISYKDMSDRQFKEWAEARKKLYRSVLLNPSASEEQKALAKKKLEITGPRPK